MTTTSPRAETILYVDRGMAFSQAFRMRTGSETGPYVTFDTTVKARLVNPAGTVDLVHGDGLSLEAVDGVPNQQVRLSLTEAQTRALPEGNLTEFEIQSGAAGSEALIVAGRIVGQGGANPDG